MAMLNNQRVMIMKTKVIILNGFIHASAGDDFPRQKCPIQPVENHGGWPIALDALVHFLTTTALLFTKVYNPSNHSDCISYHFPSNFQLHSYYSFMLGHEPC